MPDEITDQIETQATEPLESEADGLRAVQNPLPHLIAADKYLTGKANAARRNRGLQFTKLVPDGTV
jgi:hypothetical protein